MPDAYLTEEAPLENDGDPVPGDSRAPVVKGKWFVPALFVGFVLFTLFMSYGTIWLGQNLRPALQRRSVAAAKQKAEAEMKDHEAARARR